MITDFFRKLIPEFLGPRLYFECQLTLQDARCKIQDADGP